MNFNLAALSLIRSELTLLKISPFIFIGLGAVVVLLLILALHNRKSITAEPAVEATPVFPSINAVSEKTDDDLIAVIAAAVYAFGESVGQKLVIKSVQHASSHHAKTGRSAWASAGIYDNTRPF